METISGTELALRSGASYRQIDYWTSHGAITTINHVKGSGSYREFDPALVLPLRAVVTINGALGLTAAGSGGLPCEVIELIVDNYGYGMIDCGQGVTLTWEVEL